MCFLDKNKPIEIHCSRNLPHWHQDGVIQYITFRLADSLPLSKIEELKQLKSEFESKHPLPWSNEIKKEFWEIIGPVENKLLDEGYGNCVLKDKTIRKILADAIFHYDDEKYVVIAYVIMPNHVHMLLHLNSEDNINNVMQSIKSYSATFINKEIGRKGKLWQKENFDRIVRNQQHLQQCIDYIIENPKFLKPEEYELYIKYKG